jgi:hypothetical protein
MALFHGFQSCAARQMYFVAQGHAVFAGDLRQFAHSEKKPQVFRKNRGSPARPKKLDGQAIFSQLLTLTLTERFLHSVCRKLRA